MSKVIIVGGGAAGLFAAGKALENGHSVILAEHMEETGKKLLLTGKGRCNVTNSCDEETFLRHVRRNPRFLYSSLYAFPPKAVMSFFEAQGVPLKTERGRRVFPQSDRAADIRDALRRYAEKAALYHARVTEVVTQNGRACGVKLKDGRSLYADAVLLATGGLSYPATGSTGDGYRMAQKLGHTVIPPAPSLVPLTAAEDVCRRMMGLSLKNVSLRLLENEKVVFEEQGELLFAHFGLSGPLVLSASAHMEQAPGRAYTALIDWKPALDIHQLDKRILRDFEMFANREACNALEKLLPRKSISVFMQRWGVSPQRKVNQITREERERLAALLKAFPVSIKGKEPIERAVITSGGVSVREVDPKTMQSKLVPGLYFAGEVLDVDAYTGGYNLQIAFSTAYAAASHL